MVLGNPDEFSVIIEKIEEWNENEDFCNGLLFFCIGGDLLPDKIISSTLAYELHNLVEQLENIVVDKKMYNMAQHEAFKEMYTATFPEDSELDNDYQFDITPASFGDNNYCVFAVSNGEKVRILGVN